MIKPIGYLVIIAMFSIALFPLQAKAQLGWKWGIGATMPGSTDYSEVMSSAGDKYGNVFVCSLLRGDSIGFGGVNLYNSSDSAITIISKSDTIGDVEWMMSLGHSALISGMATDSSGNLIVYGMYVSILTVDTMTITGGSAFLFKLSPTGHVIWLKNIAGTSEWGSVGVDNTANIYITGEYEDSITVGSTMLYGFGANVFVFVEKYDPNGNPIWARSFGGSCSAQPLQTAVSETGKVYIYGRFSSASADTSTWHIVIGTTSLTATLNLWGEAQGLYLAKYDSSGHPLWAEYMNEPFGLNMMACDRFDQLYVTGALDSSIILGADTLTYMGDGDLFAAKFDSSGHLKWAKSGGGSSSDQGYSLALDQCGNVLIAGSMGNGTDTAYTMDIGGHLLSTPYGSADAAVILRYDTSGHYQSSMAIKSGGDDYLGISVDFRGNLYITGDYYSSMEFNTDTLYAHDSAELLFVAKYSYDTSGCYFSGEPLKLGSHPPLENIVSIFPNPTHNLVTISYTIPVTMIAITDMVGRTVYTQKYNANTVVVDVSKLSSGVYMIKINGFEVSMFVKD